MQWQRRLVRRPLPLVVVSAGLTFAIFFADIFVFRGVAFGLLYVIPILLTTWMPWRSATLIYTLIASVLTVTGYALSPEATLRIDPDLPHITWFATANRVMALVAIWISAISCMLYRHAADHVAADEARLRSIINTSVDAVVIIDALGIVQSFSRGGETLFGYSEAEVLGQNIKQLMPQPYRDEHDGYIKRYLDTGNRRIIGTGRLVKAQRKDGTIFPVYLSVGEIREGEHRFFTGFIHDMTDRVRAEEEAIEERNFVSAILDTTDALVVVVDREGRIIRFNKACERLSGYSAKEMVGRKIWRLVPEEEREAIHDNSKWAWLHDMSPRTENHWVTRSGELRTISWTGAVLSDQGSDEQYMVGTGIDVTERRAAEAHAARLQQDLFRIGRLSELGEMASAIAHELNQPLTAISNYARAGRRMAERLEGDPAAEVTPLLDKAVEQVDRAGEIIRRLRQLIGRGQSELAETDINGAVRDACGLALIAAGEKGIRARLELAEDLPMVWADATQIQQLVFNLVRNAVEALQEVEERDLIIGTGRREDGWIEVQVRDTGPGLAEEVSRNLFTPFTTTKPNGMGIGLSICRSISDAHDGKIWAEANDAGGTVFCFALPPAEFREGDNE